jgi:tetratricopeptide (TPR) repeat protein
MKLRLWVILLAGFVLLAFVPAKLAAQDNDSAPTKADDSARQTEMSSSKDTRIDISPPKDDVKNHPNSSVPSADSEEAPSDTEELHPWDPHKAAKDIEVGDYYFKRKNYRGALERYRDALVYKPNDAVANFRLAECEEKIGNSPDATQHYEAYLKILPEGPFAADAQKALERLKSKSK